MKSHLFRMDNPIMNYAWGSHTAIADLLDQPSPSKKAQAELWMGAHAKAPSVVEIAGQRLALDQLIVQDPEYYLGAALSQKYSGSLPFLLKVLAAAAPLSIQAHPSLEQARQGFAQEEAQGPERDAATRNFRDSNHKPELLCALSPFWAMAGLRPLRESRRLAQELELPQLLAYMDQSASSAIEAKAKAAGSQQILSAEARLWDLLLRLSQAQQQALLDELASALAGDQDVDIERDPLRYWLADLRRRYPRDVGVLAPLLLQLIFLQPGEAIALRAGVLHAYLRGTGIEIMANSDNVLRGGLTPKHIDVNMLLQVLDQGCEKTKILHAKSSLRDQPTDGVQTYDAGFSEFALQMISVQKQSFQLEPGVQILFCNQGKIEIKEDDEPALLLAKGQSVFASAAFGAATISGSGQLFRAFVPKIKL